MQISPINLNNPFRPNTSGVLIERIKDHIKGKKAIIAFAIGHSIANGQEHERLFDEITDMAIDNYPAMREILGKDLLIDIAKFSHV